MAQHDHQMAEQSLLGDITVDSGVSDHSRGFRQHYLINPPFNIDCAGCCWQFLVKTRQYGRAPDARMVKFVNAHTSCYVAGPQGPSGVNGVVKTEKDPNLGVVGPRPFEASHSYQLYGPQAPSGLAVGAPLTARIEAISMPVLSGPAKVRDCYFSYADAALLELYRQQKNKESLRGKCCWPTQDQQHKGDWLSKRMSKLKL